jgi:cullin-4
MGEDMFKDLALSKEMMREYHSKLPSDSGGLKLSVMVLQRSAWPFTVQKANVDLPPSVCLFFPYSALTDDLFFSIDAS